MTTKEAIEIIQIMRDRCAKMPESAERQKALDACDMAVVALQLQEGNLYLDSVKQAFQIQNAGTINM